MKKYKNPKTIAEQVISAMFNSGSLEEETEAIKEILANIEKPIDTFTPDGLLVSFLIRYMCDLLINAELTKERFI